MTIKFNKSFAKLIRSIKIWLFGIIAAYEVGSRVYWYNPYHTEYSGEYIITSKPDKKGMVGIYNEKMQSRLVHWYELRLLDDSEKEGDCHE